MPPSQEEWLRLSDLFKEAEEALHEAETIYADLSVPSVNQLRYVGHHILRSILTENPYIADEEYRKAVRHCQRAIFDAFDSAAAFLLVQVDQFQKDYASIEIIPHFPGYPDVRRKARQARDQLLSARAANSDREKYYIECRQSCRELRSCIEMLEDAREELNKAIKRHNRQILLAWYGIGGTLVTGAIGALVTILVTIL